MAASNVEQASFVILHPFRSQSVSELSGWLFDFKKAKTYITINFGILLMLPHADTPR